MRKPELGRVPAFFVADRGIGHCIRGERGWWRPFGLRLALIRATNDSGSRVLGDRIGLARVFGWDEVPAIIRTCGASCVLVQSPPSKLPAMGFR